MYQPKVENAQKYEDSQGSHIVTFAKLVLLHPPYNFKSDTNIHYDEDVICRPILISETEEIEVGDYFYHEYTNTIAQASNTSVNNIFTSLEDGKSNYIRAGCVKVLALPEHFSDKHLQAIVDSKMEDGDEVLVECTGHRNFNPVPVDSEQIIHGYVTYLDQQNHITLFPKQLNSKSLRETFKKNYDDVFLERGIGDFTNEYVYWLEELVVNNKQ